MTTALAVQETHSVGIPDATIAKLREARSLVQRGTFSELVDVAMYADAISTIAREKRAEEIAREAAETRILAARRIGELVLTAKDDNTRERLYQIIPSRFAHCEELAAIPEKLFKRAVREGSHTALQIPSVIRRARLLSLKAAEEGIWIDYAGHYWVNSRTVTGSRGRGFWRKALSLQHARKLASRPTPSVAGLDAAFSSARILASSLSQLQSKITGDVRRLISDAELKQAEVAELLDNAIRLSAGQGADK